MHAVESESVAAATCQPVERRELAATRLVWRLPAPVSATIPVMMTSLVTEIGKQCALFGHTRGCPEVMGSALQAASIPLTVCLHRYRRGAILPWEDALLYAFSDFTLDTDRRELRRGAEAISVTPQVFDLLAYLIRNRERVVSKDDLVREIWGGRIVSDAALTTRMNGARRAIGDTGAKQLLIKTLQRQGFRFVGAVQEEEQGSPVEQNGAATRGEAIAGTMSSAPRLSIVVLPFANLGGDPEQDYFTDGVTESLTTDLSRIAGSFVIGRHTAFTYRGKAINLTEIGRELNVRYVLEGSVQRGGDRLRVSVRLVDAATGAHLWAERFDKPVADLFNMQDEIVSRLAQALEAELLAAEARRAERTPDPDAMDLYFLGRASFNRGHTANNLSQARSLFARALALDPGNVAALVSTALVDLTMVGGFLTDDCPARLAAAEANLVKALSLLPRDAAALALLGVAKILSNRAAEGIVECEQALALDRNLAYAHACIGVGKNYIGRAAETEGHVREALRLSPRDIGAFWWMMFVGNAKSFIGVYPEAVVWLRRSIDLNRNMPFAHFNLAAALAQLGRFEEARAAAKIGLMLDPSFTLRRFRANSPSDNPVFLAGRERIHQGMRMAGVPDQ
jgi:TolB-like protein